MQFRSISASSRRVVGGVPELGQPGFAVALAIGGGFLVSRRVGTLGRSHAKRVAAATTPAAHATAAPGRRGDVAPETWAKRTGQLVCVYAPVSWAHPLPVSQLQWVAEAALQVASVVSPLQVVISLR